MFFVSFSTLHPLRSLWTCQSDSFTTAVVLHPQSSQLKKVNIDFSSELQSSSLYYPIKCLEQDLFFYVDQRLNFGSVHHCSLPPTTLPLCKYRDCFSLHVVRTSKLMSTHLTGLFYCRPTVRVTLKDVGHVFVCCREVPVGAGCGAV